MRPNFSDIENVPLVILPIFFRHNLHTEFPNRILSIFNAVVEVSLSKIAIFGFHLIGFFCSEVLNSLLSLKVPLNPKAFSLLVDPFISMRTISIHVSISIRSSSIRKQNGQLMTGFWYLT